MDAAKPKSDTARKLEPRGASLTARGPALPVLIVAAVGLGLSFLLFALFRRGESAAFRAEFERRTVVPASAVQREVDDYFHLVRSVEDFFYSSQSVDRREFNGFTSESLRRLPGLESLEWIPRVVGVNRLAHEQAARADGLTNYQIWQTDDQGQAIRAAERAEYLPVSFSEPASRAAAMGFDLAVNADLAATMMRARDTGKPMCSAPARTGQGTNLAVRYRAFGGVYTNLVARETDEERRRNLAGFAAAVIDLDALLLATMGRLSPYELRGIEWQLIDRGLGTETPIALSRSRGWATAVSLAAAESDGAPIEFGGRLWQLQFRPSPEYVRRRHGWESWVMLLAGFVVTGLVAAYFRSTLNRAAVVDRLVKERTAELARSNAELQAEIHQRQQTEAALAAEREMVSALMDSIPDHIYFKDRESRFIRINRSMVAAFKLKSPADAVGRSDFDYFSTEHARQAFADEQALLQSGGSLVNQEEKETWPDGSLTWVSTTKQCLRDRAGTIIGTFGVSRDITDRKKSEQRLTIQYKVARILAESESLAAAAPRILEEVGRSIYWSVGVVWNLDPAAQVMRCLETWVEPGLSVPKTLAATRELTIGPEAEFPGRVWVAGTPACIPDVAGEGSLPRMMTAAQEGLRGVFGVPIRAGGEILGILEFFSRRTEAAERELLRALDALGSQVGMFMVRRRAEESLEQKARELARSNKDLEQFAYVASHDLQEPLRMVASYTQLIERRYKDQIDEDGREFIRFAVDGAARMQTLIQDLLAFSRVGMRMKPFVPLDCNELVKKALNNLTVAIAENNASIDVGPLPVVRGDATLLIQLFQNLIGNGIKFRGGRPAVVHIRAERGTTSPPRWIFSVRDEGIGIEAQYFDRIFVLFQRLHTREEYPGTGIGLALCKRIVELHGGRIWVESKPDDGATFFFTIPADGL
jgi:PAS domain S-box-containing protein